MNNGYPNDVDEIQRQQAAAVHREGSPAPVRPRPVAPAWHTILLIAVLGGFAGLQELPGVAQRAAAQQPNRVLTYIVTIAFELFLVGYVWLLGLRLRKVPVREIIGGRWARFSDFLMDLAVALLFWIAAAAIIAGISLALRFNAAEAAKELLPQTRTELIMWPGLAVIAGFCVEFVFRGYFQRQFLAWTGSVAASVILQAAVFGIAHMYQGGKGVLVITIYGALFGILAAIRKSLRPGMIQHAGQDTISGIAGHFLTKFHYLQMLRF